MILKALKRIELSSAGDSGCGIPNTAEHRERRDGSSHDLLKESGGSTNQSEVETIPCFRERGITVATMKERTTLGYKVKKHELVFRFFVANITNIKISCNHIWFAENQPVTL